METRLNNPAFTNIWQRFLTRLKISLTLFTVFALGLTVPHSWAKDIAASADEVQPVLVGSKAPKFSVLDRDGNKVKFNPKKLAQPVVLISFRGGWCPYCNVHLQDLRHALPELEKLGVDVWFLSGDAPAALYSSLQDKTQEEIVGLDYQIYSDAKMDAASKLGIAFAIEPDMLEKFEQYGIVTDNSLGQHHALPVPAVFLVDTKGIIRYRYFNSDYKVRLSSEELLEAVTNTLN